MQVRSCRWPIVEVLRNSAAAAMDAEGRSVEPVLLDLAPCSPRLRNRRKDRARNFRQAGHPGSRIDHYDGGTATRSPPLRIAWLQVRPAYLDGRRPLPWIIFTGEGRPSSRQQEGECQTGPHNGSHRSLLPKAMLTRARINLVQNPPIEIDQYQRRLPEETENRIGSCQVLWLRHLDDRAELRAEICML